MKKATINPKTALKLLLTFSVPKKKMICPAYISNQNSIREKQIILLMIPNEEKEG